MKVIDCDQGTAAWFAARLGKVGASMVHDATAETRNGWAATRGELAARLVVERLTGRIVDQFVSPAMAHGSATEPQAREVYGYACGEPVVQVGLVLHPTIDDGVASPDGLVGSEGLVEIKCPTSRTHIDTLLGAPVDVRYLKQMQWQMACTGRAWCDFVSFDPRLPEEMQFHVRRVARDDVMIGKLEGLIAAFLAEIDATVARLNALYREQAAA